MIDTDTDPRSWALINLGDFVKALDLAFEGDVEERLWYVGQLADCARLFASITAAAPARDTQKLIELKSRAYGMSSRPNEYGQIIKEAWNEILPILDRYIEWKIKTE